VLFENRHTGVHVHIRHQQMDRSGSLATSNTSAQSASGTWKPFSISNLPEGHLIRHHLWQREPLIVEHLEGITLSALSRVFTNGRSFYQRQG
jgi:hypothetical protein